MVFKIKTQNLCFILTIFLLPVKPGPDINTYFNGNILAQKALRYNEQEAIIKNAPTKTNDLPGISILLSFSASEIENRLETRAADAIELANAAIQSIKNKK